MKKLILLIIIAVLATACSDDLSNINQDNKNPDKVPSETLFANATKNLVDQMVNTNVNTNIFKMVAQYWTETTYTDEANFNLNERNITGEHWTILYSDVIKDLEESRRLIDVNEEELLVDFTVEELDNQRAALIVLKVYTYHVLVDTFGDIPYTEAMDIENTTPAYDDDKVIYDEISTQLDTAIALMDVNSNGFDGGSDLLYDGNTSSWMKFANSLKLRLALRYAEIDDEMASKMAQEAVEAGVFTSSDDNADMQYLNTAPNTNPIWEDLVQSGRTDFVAANTIVDEMNTLDDPRRDDYFAPNQDDPDTEEVEYIGGVYGANGNTHSNSTIYSSLLENPALEGVIMDYSEVEFLIAEGIERGYLTGDAEEHYNNAITASILYWEGTSEEADEYLSQNNVAYSTAADSWEEKIGMQKWISLYNRGFEAWSSYRKLGYPILPNAELTDNPVPTRFTYPRTEASNNSASYNAASDAIGGDEQQSKIFWDID